MTFKPLRLNGYNVGLGPPDPRRPDDPFWHDGWRRHDVAGVEVRSDIETIASEVFNAVRCGLLPSYIWGDGWEAETTRLIPMLEASMALGLWHIYPVWYSTEAEELLAVQLMGVLREYPHVIPQIGRNERAEPSNPEGPLDWDTYRGQIDTLRAEWPDGRPWITAGVAPRQDGTLGLDWVDLSRHATTWPDAYLGVHLYGEDGVQPYPGGHADAYDIANLIGAYGNRLVVTEHGRSRSEIRKAWRELAGVHSKRDPVWTNAAPMPRWSGFQYVWRWFGAPDDPRAKYARFVTTIPAEGVEA